MQFWPVQFTNEFSYNVKWERNWILLRLNLEQESCKLIFGTYSKLKIRDCPIHVALS